MALAVALRASKQKNRNFNLPGESSDTGVLDGVGLCPGGRKCEGDPLLEPPPVPMEIIRGQITTSTVNFASANSPPCRF